MDRIPNGRQNIPGNSVYISLLAAAALLAIGLHAGLLLQGYYSVSADESGHTLDAYHWVSSKSFGPGVWLPLYNIIVGEALQWFPDLFVTPRVISFLFGLLSLGLLVLLSHELFHDRRVDAAAAFLGAVFPPRVILAVVPLTEIMFIAVITAAMVAVARWLASPRPLPLLATSLLLAIASAIRYEGWIFAACFVVLVAAMQYRPRRTSRFPAMACLILAAFPLCWVCMHAFGGAGALAFIRVPAADFVRVRGASDLAAIQDSPAVQFLLQNAVTGNLLGGFLLIEAAAAEPRLRRWLVVPAAALLVLSAGSILFRALPNHSFWRVPAVWSILLIPFTARWVVRQAEPDPGTPGLRSGLRKAAPWFILIVLVVQCLIQLGTMSAHPNFDRDDLALGQFLSTRLDGDHRAVIETWDWKYLHILVASRHPDAFIPNSGADPLNPDRGMITRTSMDGVPRFRSLRVKFFLFRDPVVKKILDNVHELKRLGDFGDWSVYEMRDS